MRKCGALPCSARAMRGCTPTIASSPIPTNWNATGPTIARAILSEDANS